MQVLFLHGIEARGWPLKAEMVASLSGVAVHCPDLGSASWMQKIWIIAGFGILAFLAVSVAVAWGIWAEDIGVVAGVLVCLVTPFALYTSALYAVRYCLRRAYDDATERAQHAVKVLRPDVVVGQSFGAVVALRLQQPDTPLLLLSCARRYFCSWAGVPQPQCPPGVPVAVVHGSADELNAIEDAVDLVNKAKGGAAWLVRREGEGHMLPGLGAGGLAEILQHLGVEYTFLPEPRVEKPKKEKKDRKERKERKEPRERREEPEGDDERMALLAPEPRIA